MSDTPRTDALYAAVEKRAWGRTPAGTRAEDVFDIAQHARELECELSAHRWHPVAPGSMPEDEQKVLAYWPPIGGAPEGFEVLRFFACDAPDSRERWEDSLGDCHDEPANWKPLEAPK